MLPVSVQHHVYHGFDRKPCEVEVDGTWYSAELRSWDRDAEGRWSASVAWTRGPAQTYLDTFPADRVRAP